MTGTTLRTALGSYAFRYAIGFDGFQPPHSMTPLDFLGVARNLGFKGVQLCENLRFADGDERELAAIRGRARELDLFVEVGMKELSLESITRHIAIADRVDSGLLRIVIGDDYSWRRAEEDRRRVVDILQAVLPECRERGITIGLENRFDLRSRDLVRIVEEIADGNLGLIFDTTNGIGFIEHPLDTLQKFLPCLLSLHLKDFVMEKIEAEYRMRGVPLGEGWLDVECVLKTALEANPDLSVVLEMTVQRAPGQSMDEVLEWERDCVERSAAFLRRSLDAITG